MPSPPDGTAPRRCPECGGELIEKALNYWYEQTTDYLTAADTILVCRLCNSTFPGPSHPKPSWWSSAG